MKKINEIQSLPAETVVELLKEAIFKNDINDSKIIIDALCEQVDSSFDYAILKSLQGKFEGIIKGLTCQPEYLKIVDARKIMLKMQLLLKELPLSQEASLPLQEALVKKLPLESIIEALKGKLHEIIERIKKIEAQRALVLKGRNLANRQMLQRNEDPTSTFIKLLGKTNNNLKNFNARVKLLKNCIENVNFDLSKKPLEEVVKRQNTLGKEIAGPLIVGLIDKMLSICKETNQKKYLQEFFDFLLEDDQKIDESLRGGYFLRMEESAQVRFMEALGQLEVGFDIAASASKPRPSYLLTEVEKLKEKIELEKQKSELTKQIQDLELLLQHNNLSAEIAESSKTTIEQLKQKLQRLKLSKAKLKTVINLTEKKSSKPCLLADARRAHTLPHRATPARSRLP